MHINAALLALLSFTVAVSAPCAFAQGTPLDDAADLFPSAKRARDRLNSLNEAFEEKIVKPATSMKEKIYCQMRWGPEGCTDLTGGTWYLSKEEIEALRPEARAAYKRHQEERELERNFWRRPARNAQAGEGTGRPVSPQNDRPGYPSPQPNAQVYDSRKPAPQFTTQSEDIGLPAGGRAGCVISSTEAQCINFYKLAAITHELTTREPANYQEAEAYCNELADFPLFRDVVALCKQYYRTNFRVEPPQRTVESRDGASNSSPSASPLEAMMRGQQEKESTEAEALRLAALRRHQERVAAAAREQQQQAAAEAAEARAAANERANANAEFGNALRGIIGGAAAARGRGGVASTRGSVGGSNPGAGSGGGMACPYGMITPANGATICAPAPCAPGQRDLGFTALGGRQCGG